MATLTETAILDEPDALTEDCGCCWCHDGYPEECCKNYDPSPMCNCGMCADGEATCVRQD